jgi:GWxTD domain-containing protein
MRGWRLARLVPFSSALGTVLLSACATRPRPQPPTDPAPAAAQTSTASQRRFPTQRDDVALYRRMGLLAEGGETPFVGTLSFFAAPTDDSTLIVLTVALANRSLHFGREGDRYRAAYDVGLEVRQGTQLVRQLGAKETVRVLVFRETMRTDESVLFRQMLNLAPGTYEMRLTVRDEGVSRGSAVEATVGVPRFREGSVSSPVPFYEASARGRRDTLPSILATPRATVVFGRDSVLPIYAEGYSRNAEFPLRVTVRSDDGSGVLWSDSIALPRRADLFSGTFTIPIGKVGVGVMTVGINREGSADTVRTPVFVAFGEDLPVATFSEMLTYLRYYVSASRLGALREARTETRAALWAAFLRDTDPFPQTPQHEGLRDYFGRIAQANARFREDASDGWLSDRGRVYVALGNPDQIFEPSASNMGQRGSTLIWDYRQHRLQVVFVDQTGFGRWRMTMSSESEFESVVRRVLIQ